jgi:hypothetical protein
MAGRLAFGGTMTRFLFAAVIFAMLFALVSFFACGSGSDKETTDDDNDAGDDDTYSRDNPPTEAENCPQADIVPGAGITWASEVISFSTQWGEDLGNWSAQDALGAPNCLDATNRPVYGDQGCAWATADVTDGEFIELGFENHEYPPSRVYIYEVIGIDGISEVRLTFEDGSEIPYAYTPEVETQCVKIHKIDIVNPTLQVTKIKITMDQTTVGYWTEIDAVGLI